ncbi:hypothetical protein V6x_32190 [Gimesia chilikensis]|uniref:PPi-type phosphoenolpyruvate carboxykinase lobe 2 domain-containing protein n=1 Tax=Gimesia chilikensis TaxID=2605989 RepID=A0A517WE19_9PLAN|nr:hypothetical protein [Gimesia chilikensis]QDU03499.1 hypothetical protein V6x_32190 [Gimesia chilikensis]
MLNSDLSWDKPPRSLKVGTQDSSEQFRQALGLDHEGNATCNEDRDEILRYLNLQLIANGYPAALTDADRNFADIAQGLLENHRQKNRLLVNHRCPVDQRIENFLQSHFSDVPEGAELKLPARTLILDRFGLARELSLPIEGDEYHSDLVQSYRVKNGVLHNPKHDRRTTVGTFHVTEGGLPVPGDKRSVPRETFVKMFQHAMNPPDDLKLFPFTSEQAEPASGWASLLLRPIVCPEVKGVTPEKRMEVRFFAPGTLVSNLDFVESIFGNAGDPFVPMNDSGLDVMHWTGHTGAVILAPHLITLTKQELGLPHWDDATERQQRDSMCWKTEDEFYNDGMAFKLTCRTEEGVIVTLIADNYFGYCKKEVKTQISYSANLFGNAEEEHAGGTMAYPSYNLGEGFQVNSVRYNGRTFDDVIQDYGDHIEGKPEGYGIDSVYPELVYIPEDAYASLPEQCIRWIRGGKEHSIPLLPGQVYMAPSGYHLRMEKHPAAPSWRIVGTTGEGIFCHKPCTVSGGGKSEISKSIQDYMLYGPVFVSNYEKDMEAVREIIEKDYSDRWLEPLPEGHPDLKPSRGILDLHRSLGSVIKLLTPSPAYTPEFNEWLNSIPDHILALVFIIKRIYWPSWGEDWDSHFGVDIVNGTHGHELKYRERKLVGTYLRVGLFSLSGWRTFKVRQDFIASLKIQTEDDISASVIVPSRDLPYLAEGENSESCKFVINSEYRLFQRPDDAIVRGLDKQTELDLSKPGNFISNFEPLSIDQVREMSKYVVDFDAFSPPMQDMLHAAEKSNSSYVVCSANPRQIDGKPTKNPRYLQTRPDLVKPFNTYVAKMATRLFRAIPADHPVHNPVNAVMVGRRNNPPEKEKGIRSLAVYSPIHYQELPELFMDFVCSLTGKSPSTTGAGSEGALTKGPFNALRPSADLNSALVGYILTGYSGFSTAAGHIGPNVRVDHDISLLIPEIWCRMSPEERSPEFLIQEGLLEPIKDFEHEGVQIPASRLGYRITYKFLLRFFGRVFDNPASVFDETILKPEKQDLESFVDGIQHIAEAQQRVALQYFEDGGYEEACPPLQAILSIMAHGNWEGHTIHDKEVRDLFTRENLLQSDWYQERLAARQDRESDLLKRHLEYLDQFSVQPGYDRELVRLQIPERRKWVEEQLAHVSSPAYLEELKGTIGAEPTKDLKGTAK